MSESQVAHFFLGSFASERALLDFIEEDYFVDDHEPISQFCGSQGETFIDHDVMETGFRVSQPTLSTFFETYSYATQWSDELALRAAGMKLADANSLIFIAESEIEFPRSVAGNGFALTYLGRIAYQL